MRRRDHIARLAALLVAASMAGSVSWGCAKNRSPRGRGDSGVASFEPLALAAVQARVLAAAAVPSLDGTIERAVAIARNAVGFPIDARGAREAVLLNTPLPPDVLDLTRPAGAAVVSLGTGKPAAKVIALAVKSRDAATRAIAALGMPIERRGDAVMVRIEGKPTWLWLKDEVILVSNTADGLAAGAAAALEARRANAKDASVRLFPPAIATHQGTDVASAARKVVDEMHALRQRQLARAGADTAAVPMPRAALADSVSQALTELILARVAEATAVEIDIALDPVVGATVTARLHARPETDLARAAQATQAYAVAPALLAASGRDAGGIAAVGSMDFAAPALGALASAVRGRPASGGVWFEEGGVAAYEAVLGLADASVGPRARRELLAAAGRDTEVASAVSRDRLHLLIAVGPDARRRLRELVSSTGGKPTGVLATALSETAGHGQFGYLDLASAIRAWLPDGTGFASALIGAAIPVYGSLHGDGKGGVITGSLRIPIAAFAGAGKAARVLMTADGR